MGKSGEVNSITKKKNGDFYWELAFITPIKNEMGKISHYLAIKEDITDRKELELQLIQSQKMESVGTLAGGISHDFNNILTVINGYSDLALMRLKETDPLYNEIATIKKAGRRGEKLTRQIMAFSRKQIFHPLIININFVIKDLENTLVSLIEEDFNISFKLNPDIPLIKADPSQIEQILINLLVNARDAINLKTQIAEEKLITVETGIQFIDESFIKKHIGSTQGPHIYISVSDNGIG
ncbi:MAG: PAS domain S-box protein, partial [Candidatus Aminicenantes bacterium]|nr:PAS domain S-box protein [Candidatus Aminicenantes bacterium]